MSDIGYRFTREDIDTMKTAVGATVQNGAGWRSGRWTAEARDTLVLVAIAATGKAADNLSAMEARVLDGLVWHSWQQVTRCNAFRVPDTGELLHNQIRCPHCGPIRWADRRAAARQIGWK